MSGFDVEMVTVDGGPTALGSAGPITLVADRPAAAGGRGLGFNGGQLLNLAVAACISNDLYREAAAKGLTVTRVAVRVRSDYGGQPVVSSGIEYDVDLEGTSSAEDLAALLEHVDRIAEIPTSLRMGTAVRLVERGIVGGPDRASGV
jgi:organic hydroperoxide reductase OsmC/OhrA